MDSHEMRYWVDTVVSPRFRDEPQEVGRRVLRAVATETETARRPDVSSEEDFTQTD